MRITDGGLETTLIFDRGLELPYFAAFTLLETDEGADTLRAYFEPYLALAQQYGAGFLLDTPTWRADADWGERLGYSAAALDSVNRRAVELCHDIRSRHAVDTVLAGLVGPRGDGYSPGLLMDAATAERYHAPQIETLADEGVDVVTAVTLTYPDEAIGVVRAAQEAGVPAAISFTVETDGRLPDGTSLREAIDRVDAATDGAADYFMVNCAYPTHIARGLDGGAWQSRIGGIRANASMRSHAELDGAAELDTGDPVQLAVDLAALQEQLPALEIVGGCCGTGERHLAAICERSLASCS